MNRIAGGDEVGAGSQPQERDQPASDITVDFWRPDPRLAPYVSGYHRYVLGGDGTRRSDVFFPSWANIRFSFDADPWSIAIGRRKFDPVPDNAFFGPSSHAGYVDAGRGTLVGIGLTPLGWARLHGGDLSRFADRVVELGMVSPVWRGLRDAVTAAPSPAPVFDACLLTQLDEGAPDNPAIPIIAGRLLDPTIDKVADLGAGLDLTDRQVARLSRVIFGFTPKLLLRRARFLRALDGVRATERGLWMEAVRHAGYWDGPHFLRDCNLFLGMSLGQFMSMDRPINRASIRMRNDVLGASMQSLHQPVSST